MEHKIYQMKINGIIEIDEPLDEETEYSIALERIQQKEGEYNVRVDKMDRKIITYKVVNLGEATLIAEGIVIKGKAKSGKQSVALRMSLEELYEQQYSANDKYKDKEHFYKEYMSKLIDVVKSKLL